MTDHDDEDHYPPKPRWIGWAIAIFMVAAALGVANIGWRIMMVSPAEKAAEALVQQHPELAAGKKLVETSDCMRCHGWDRGYVGPAFVAIAERYRGQPDAEAYLARKIREGSVGAWGKVIMPRQSQVDEAQSLQIARWLLAAEPVAK
ncbi:MULTISPECIES: c-type cytochrome [Comamonas]|jgi:cytochrome c551/c552|uniref:Cytochrome C n=1 Tax=Comamonas terrigena TaxID=32013 RepID=A0A2A7UT36_COMTR|nr:MULTISPECIES: c-type cytochrome [Comamonas]MBD9532283.1 c-type cytochrome [Comamonas sp. CMM01]MBV7418499.1 c-type cytochrome [Comamonas sp. CMM03]MDH0048177.1 c-type cytochrome [Comamonas terrigena]MDH0510585.1 c-type cytochrome [Comamonas terrigena]MDH1090508.1 c-type cytochrome [Comamonas terrigena]